MCFQVQSAGLDGRIKIGFRVALPRINLAQESPGIERIRVGSDVAGEQDLGIRELAMLHHRTGLLELGIIGPCEFFLDGLVGFLLDAGITNRNRGQRSEEKPSDVRPMRHAADRSEQGSIEDFDSEPQRQQPVRTGLEAPHSEGIAGAQKADDAEPPDPRHLDFHLGEADQERSHQRGHGSRRAKRRGNAARVEPCVELQRCRARDQVERRVQPASPNIFQHESREPQKPHVTDQVHPAAVQEISGQIAHGAGMRRNKCVLLGDGSGRELYVLLVQRIHLLLKLLRILHQLDLGVVGVDDVAVGALHLLPLIRSG